MSHLFLDTRDGRRALYLNGDLQFDARDERLYHEPLALVPTALAARRGRGLGLRVLILGGGDGLALREVLRFAEVAEAHVVDRDPEVLGLGRGLLADLNRGAFQDPRVRAHVGDAREFLARARDFHVIIHDLTYPRDLAGTALFGLPFFRRVRAALRPEGVLAVNAVSPERTPRGFGCVAATLAAAGLWPLPYAFALPSFQAEGYGRWGFLFASRRPISDAEVGSLRFPPGASLTPREALDGMRLPPGAARRMRAAPNRTDELLYYLANDAPLTWKGPFRRFHPAQPAVGRGPRLTVAQGFARWLRAPDGRRSLEELLRCVPLPQRGQTREALLEWSQQAEVMVRGLDLGAFVERALRRARDLPRAWVRELRALRDRLRDGLPSMHELLHQAYRVFAILLLVLLLANLFFPDNLYAKGFSSSRTTSGGGSVSFDPSHGFYFTRPTSRYAPYRFRPGLYGRPVSGIGADRARVLDPAGRAFPPEQVTTSDPEGRPRLTSSLLALTKDLHLLENGALVYAAHLPSYQFLLEPGRLRVQDQTSRDLLALHPTRALHDEAKRQVEAQGPLIEKALADHRRWLAWVGWAAGTPQGRAARSELEELEAIKAAIETARGAWGGPLLPAPFAAGPGWIPVVPGVYLARATAGRPGPAAILVTPEGEARTRPLGELLSATLEDRIVLRLLAEELACGRDAAKKERMGRLLAPHMGRLGLASGPCPQAGARW